MSGRLIRDANRWRSSYNPLRGLTLQRAVSLLESGELGRYVDLQWTYRFIEKREPTLRALKRLRISALKKLDWDIRTVDDSEAAKAQAEALRSAYDRIVNLREAVAFLALAEFRGFAHLEKIYAGDVPAQGVVRLEPVPQWHMGRDGLYCPWRYDATATGTQGKEINPEHFIIREVEDPIDEIALICYLRKNLSQKDWDGFVETYGIPPIFGELPPDTDDDDVKEYQAMMEAVVSDFRGTIPNGAKVHTVDIGKAGASPFKEHLEYQDAQLVLAGTSGKLTMLNGPEGLGGGQSDVHQDTFDELAEAEAGEISEILQREFDAAVLRVKFAGQPVLAYFELAAKTQTDVGSVLDHAAKAKTAGLQVDAAEISEKTGYKLTAAPAAPVASGGGFGGGPLSLNRASPVVPPNAELRRAALDRIAQAVDAKLKPIRDRLQAALDTKDDAAFDAAIAELPALKAELPKILKAQGADDATVKAFMDSYAAALIDGAASAAQARTTNRASGLRAWLISLFRS